jgi:uncharacterized protein (DUF433 family)
LVSDVIELLAAGLSIEEIVRDHYPDLSEDIIRETVDWVAKIVRGSTTPSALKALLDDNASRGL